MLYSVIVRFKAKDDIYFRNYPGESMHGMLFHMLGKRDEKKASILHNQYDTKPFTFSPIMPYPKWEKGKRRLKANKLYFFRVTFLEDEWYLLFMEYFLYHGAELNLQGIKIEVIEALTHSNQDKRCNSMEYGKLWEESGYQRKIKFKFHSTTTFRVGDIHIIYPTSQYFFYNLIKKWEEFSDRKLSLTDEDLKKVYISRYNLSSVMEKFKDYPIKGFRGSCEYEIDSSLSKEKVRELNLMADFAFYSGVGYKTTMGLGQVARV